MIRFELLLGEGTGAELVLQPASSTVYVDLPVWVKQFVESQPLKDCRLTEDSRNFLRSCHLFGVYGATKRSFEFQLMVDLDNHDLALFGHKPVNKLLRLNVFVSSENALEDNCQALVRLLKRVWAEYLLLQKPFELDCIEAKS